MSSLPVLLCGKDARPFRPHWVSLHPVLESWLCTSNSAPCPCTLEAAEGGQSAWGLNRLIMLKITK